MLKKISSIVVALALVMTLIPATAFADTHQSKTTEKPVPAVETTTYSDINALIPAMEESISTSDALISSKNLMKGIGDYEWDEQEYNNDVDNADWLENDDTYYAYLSRSDVDMFWFSSKTQFSINVTVAADSSTLKFGVYDDESGQFLRLGSYLTYDEGLYIYKLNTTLPAGVYYLVFLESKASYTCEYAFYFESNGDEYIPGDEGYVESDVYRIYGQSRYDTAYKTAEELLSYMDGGKFSSVVIADGRNFPDALAGSYLACRSEAPILLTSSSTNTSDPGNITKLKTWINNHVEKSGRVYVLGGTGAVADRAVNGLLRDYDVIRVQGDNRYGTNMAILEQAGLIGNDILVCTGTGYADSLSASSLGLPILLVGSSLTEEQKDFISINRDKNYYLIGGEGVVKPAIEDEMYENGARFIYRVAGSDRYKTSIAVAETFFGEPETAVLAYALNYPDGLCAGPLANMINAPLLLVTTTQFDDAKSYIEDSYIYGGYVLGGPALISSNAARAVYWLPFNAIINNL